MPLAAHIKASLELPDMIVRAYLDDMSDAELLTRPGEGMNHIAWQLGHLISSENFHINQLKPGSMPSLPEGFAEKHGKEAASSDEAADFLTKAAYLEHMAAQRAGTFTVLDTYTDEELAQPSPEPMRYFGPTIGAIFAGQSAHWMMHAGQWAVVRRKLGRLPLF